MNTENPAHIASISEASPSSHETLLCDFSLKNDKCTCVADADETCMHCAVKEYQEALQKVRDYSIKCAMPKIKNTRKGRKRFYQNYARDSEQSDTCNKNAEPSKNCSAELQRDQTSDTENSLFNTETNSISSPTQNSHTSFQPSTNFQHAENCTTDTSMAQSLQTQNCRTSDTEDCHEHSQLETELLIKSEPCDINSDDTDARMSESSQEITSRSESFERSDETCDYESDHSNSSVNLQEYQDFKPKILLDIKVEPCDNDDSDSIETQNTISDCQQDQNHSPDSPVDKDLNIRTKLCDMNSNSKETEDFHLYYQLGNELHIKSEPCDTDSNSKKETQDCRDHSKLGNEAQIKSEPCDINSDSDPLMSESSQEIKSHSESFKCSDEDCDREIDHSNSSSMAEVKSAKPSDENHDDSPPNQDLKRSRRNSKRKREVEDRCPVCGLTVRYTELESHFAKEVENLSNIPRNVRKNRSSYKEREGFRCGVNIGFVQAKCNRENRLAEKRAKYVKKHIVFCPVCKIRLSGTDEEINDHVLSCFGEDDDSDINVTDFDENFEEYEIGDETRIRAISLVPGGHSALHGYSSKSKSANDEDDGVDVNVDVDDTLAFGKPQYTELDVIHNISGASNEKEEQLRRAVVSDPSAEPHVIEGKKWSRDCDIQNDIDEIISSCKESKPTEVKPKEDDEDMKMEGNFKEEENSQNSKFGIISSLKERIKDLEQQKNVKCLICLEPYTRPVVSTTCWHVHCEECWLVSMGVKKLCPQCNMIVFPTDLRRIYL